MESFAIISLKGGVGKTTMTCNLGAALAQLGKKALLIDLDPQTDLTRSVGIDAFQTKGVEYLLERDLKFNDVVKTVSENLDILPASKKLKAMELSLSNIFVKAKDNYFCYLLKNVVEPQKNRYDYVLIDCPPSSGFLTINALAFVKNILVPVECQFLGFESTKRTLSLISKVKRFSNREINPPTIVPLMFDARNKLSYLIHQRLQAAFNSAMTQTKIRVNVSLAEAPAFGKTIFDYKPKSRGAEDFISLAKEIVKKFNPGDPIFAAQEDKPEIEGESKTVSEAGKATEKAEETPANVKEDKPGEKPETGILSAESDKETDSQPEVTDHSEKENNGTVELPDSIEESKTEVSNAANEPEDKTAESEDLPEIPEKWTEQESNTGNTTDSPDKNKNATSSSSEEKSEEDKTKASVLHPARDLRK